MESQSIKLSIETQKAIDDFQNKIDLLDKKSQSYSYHHFAWLIDFLLLGVIGYSISNGNFLTIICSLILFAGHKIYMWQVKNFKQLERLTNYARFNACMQITAQKTKKINLRFKNLNEVYERYADLNLKAGYDDNELFKMYQQTGHGIFIDILCFLNSRQADVQLVHQFYKETHLILLCKNDSVVTQCVIGLGYKNEANKLSIETSLLEQEVSLINEFTDYGPCTGYVYVCINDNLALWPIYMFSDLLDFFEETETDYEYKNTKVNIYKIAKDMPI